MAGSKVLSAWSTSTGEVVRERGMNDVIGKPVQPVDFARVLKRFANPL